MRLKPISDFDGYSVSDSGWIESNDRYIVRNSKNGPHPKKINRRILKTGLNDNGYHFVTLRRDGKAFPKTVHVLVAYAFLGPRPKGLVIHHKDNDKNNNAAINLEYVTRQKNALEYHISKGKRLGTIPISDLPVIISRIESGESIYKIASEYNVSRGDVATITRVLTLTGKELAIDNKSI